MKKAMMWLAMLGFLMSSISFPATVGAQELFDDFDEDTSLSSEEDDSSDSSSEDQYEDEEDPFGDESSGDDLFDEDTSFEDESLDDEDTSFEEDTSSEGDFFSEETTSSTEGDEDFGEGTIPEEDENTDITENTELTDVTGIPSPETTDDPPAGNVVPPTESGGGERDGWPWPFGDGSGGDSDREGEGGEAIIPPSISWPPMDPTTVAPSPGDDIDIQIFNNTLNLTIIDIYDGTIICGLPDGRTVEILLYDLDGDGFVSFYECYVCLCGWVGYRYYDYTPDQIYNHIGDVYNINVSNTYEQSGAISPTPVDRVRGVLPDTGGPALIGIAVGFAVVGAALIGRYSNRPSA